MEPRFELSKCEERMRHFRCLTDIKDNQDPRVIKVGVERLYASGSGQFGGTHLRQLQDKVDEVASKLGIQKPEIWIIDLRTERHFFRGNDPMTWKVLNDHLLDANKRVDEIIADEDRLFAGITKTTVVWDRKDQPQEMGEARILKERELVEGQGFRYLRLPIAEHSKPTDDRVEELVHFIITHPHAWIHAHCYVKERTTIALAIFDMLQNARDISIEDIFYRQRAMDGSDLSKVPAGEHHASAIARVEFLRKFYAYCKEVDPLRNPSPKKWKEWLQEQEGK